MSGSRVFSRDRTLKGTSLACEVEKGTSGGGSAITDVTRMWAGALGSMSFSEVQSVQTCPGVMREGTLSEEVERRQRCFGNEFPLLKAFYGCEDEIFHGWETPCPLIVFLGLDKDHGTGSSNMRESDESSFCNLVRVVSDVKE